MDKFRALLLAGTIIRASLPAPAPADTIKIGGTGAAMGTARILAEAFQESHPGAKVKIIPGLSSGGGRRALLKGAIDIALTAKPMKRVEKVKGAVAVLYGRTPFVFATSRKNPISALSLREVVDAYSGKTTTWANGKRLRLILRPETDSDTGMLKGISPAMERAVNIALSREGMTMAVTDRDSAHAMETIPGALGTSTLALILSEKRSLKALSLNGMMPAVKAIASGSYPYFKSLYIVVRPRSKSSELTQQFVSFVRSARGRKILARFGHWVNGIK